MELHASLATSIISQPMRIACPCCGHVLLNVNADDSEMPDGGYWLDDGLKITGFDEIVQSRQRQGSGFAHTVFTGQCMECAGRYYVVLAAFVHGVNEKLNAMDVENLLYAAQVTTESNFRCYSESSAVHMPKEWLLTAFPTPYGPAHVHYIGPFKLETDQATSAMYSTGQYARAFDSQHVVQNAPIGKALAHSQLILLAIWDSAIELNRGALSTTVIGARA